MLLKITFLFASVFQHVKSNSISIPIKEEKIQGYKYSQLVN